jgi:hypothetical protein
MQSVLHLLTSRHFPYLEYILTYSSLNKPPKVQAQVSTDTFLRAVIVIRYYLKTQAATPSPRRAKLETNSYLIEQSDSYRLNVPTACLGLLLTWYTLQREKPFDKDGCGLSSCPQVGVYHNTAFTKRLYVYLLFGLLKPSKCERTSFQLLI